MKHKHYECIVAWAEGKQIEFCNQTGRWEDLCGTPSWWEDYGYRIKPEPKPDVVRYLYCGFDSWFEAETKRNNSCIKIVVDGETGKLKSAELV